MDLQKTFNNEIAKINMIFAIALGFNILSILLGIIALVLIILK